MKLFNLMSAFVVFATLGAPISSHFLPFEDQFEELFEAEAPIEEIFMELLGNDPSTNLKHLQQVQQHMNTKNDRLAPYAKKLMIASQNILNHLLKEINYKRKIDVVKFANSAYDENDNSSKKNAEMVGLAEQLNGHLEKVFENSMQQAKKNIIGRLLSVVDDATNDESVPKKETFKSKEVGKEKESSTKRRNPKLKKSKSSMNEIGKDSTESSRKLGRSQLRKSSSNKSPDV